MTAAVHWTLSTFIRAYRIRAECTPIPISPFARDDEKQFVHHKCKLYMGGHERRRMVIPYATEDRDSVRLVNQMDASGKVQQVLKSYVSTYEVLYTLGKEAALYEIAKQRITGVQLDPVSKKTSKKGAPPPDSQIVQYDRACWASIVFRYAPLPPPDELERLYENTRREVENLRVFLGGHAEDSHTPAYRVLISRVDEIAVFVYNWTEGMTCG